MFKLELATILMVIISLGLKKKRVLTTLITLELFRLLIIFSMVLNGDEIHNGLMIICIGACEGAVGLGTMIRITRLKLLIVN